MTRLRVFAILALAAIPLLTVDIVSSGDSCPSKPSMASCTCTHVPVSDLLDQVSTTTQMPTEVDARAAYVQGNPSLEAPHSAREIASSNELQQQVNISFHTVVTCNEPKTLHIVNEVMSTSLNRRCIDKLVVSKLPPKIDHTLVNLPPRWLKRMRVKHFEIRDTLLAGDFIYADSPFKGQDKCLMWFEATNCYLSGILSYDTVGTVNTKGLDSLPRIEGVNFSNNLLVSVSSFGFKYPPANLSTIILSFNSIRDIDSGAFQYVQKLKYVDLSHNLLEVIIRGVFASPARHLQHIDLSWNQLTVLPTDFFGNMPQLKIVNFTKNFLYTLPSQPWAVAWRQLTFVDLSHNFLACDCSLLWIRPILSNPAKNSTVTETPKALPGQTVIGTCTYNEPKTYPINYKLTSLTRSSLNCQL